MYRIAEISFAKSRTDAHYNCEYRGRSFEVQRFGANLSVPFMLELIKSVRNHVDAIAISDLPSVFRIGGKSYVHRQYLEVMSTQTSVPLCDGSRIRELGTMNGIHDLIESGQIDPTRGVFFPVGLLNLDVVYSLSSKYARYFYLGDLMSVASLPLLVQPSRKLEKIGQTLFGLLNMRDIKSQTPLALNPLKIAARSHVLHQVRRLQYVFSDPSALQMFDGDLSFVRDKDVIIPWSHPIFEEEILKCSPRRIINLFPSELQLSAYMNYSVADAVLRLAHGKTAALSLEEWEQLLSTEIRIHSKTRRFVLGSRPSRQSQLTATIQKAKNRFSKEKSPDFAFVIHALSKEDLFRVPGLKPLSKLPEGVINAIEKTASRLPGVTYGYANHIISKKNHREYSGVIYGLPATPKMLLNEDPEVTYRKIENLCHHAADMGAKIIGLGAYTKVVGDSGATINRNSPIPVTTGNSLSAASTLWALDEVVRKMAILQELDGVYDAGAMVIGATGSIGSVSAKLLSRQYRRLYLVAPRIDRLKDLANEIRKMAPECEVFVFTDANECADKVDVLVTATSSFDQKIVDVGRLRPGCVVCDCSRPLDFSLEDAIRRPDVVIIESGEVILPGPYQITCDIGLSDHSVYACMGETAVLAMEGLYEPYTLGRNIEWTKVERMKDLAVSHGVKLAAIRGHVGYVTDKEIKVARELALRRRAEMGLLSKDPRRTSEVTL